MVAAVALLTVLMVFEASSEARVRRFGNFSIDMPARWKYDDDDDDVVVFGALDGSATLTVATIENEDEDPLGEWAEAALEVYEGRNLRKSGNVYTFQFETEGLDGRAAVTGSEIFLILATAGRHNDLDGMLNSLQVTAISDQVKREMLVSLGIERAGGGQAAEENTVRIRIWDEYVRSQSSDSTRIAEMRGSAISFGGVTMRFTCFVIGRPGNNGYPLFIAMHGGGAGSAQINDQQYEHMKSYY